jgi:hypothetical protein
VPIASGLTLALSLGQDQTEFMEKPFRVVALLSAGIALLATLTIAAAFRSGLTPVVVLVGGGLVTLAAIGLFGYSHRARRSARLAGVLCVPLFVLTGFSTGPGFLLGAFLLLAGTDRSHWAVGRATAST